MKTILRVTALAAGIFVSQPCFAETMTNDSVIALTKAGLGDATIVAKIRNSPTAFDLSTNELVRLKGVGVDDAVLSAMLDASNGAMVTENGAIADNPNNPLAPHASGIYLLTNEGDATKMVHLDVSTAAQSKNSGTLTYALTYGIAKMRSKAVLNTPSARLQVTDSRPVFYFYFDEENTSLSKGGSPWMGLIGQANVTSPNEFTLVHLEKKKNSREYETGNYNIVGSSSGINEKQRVSFSYENVAPGVFKVTSDVDLKPGEYGFIYSASAGGPAAMYGIQLTTPKIFDFAVDGANE